MIVIAATWQREVGAAAVAGLAASVVPVIVLALASLRQRRQVLRLDSETPSAEALRQAVSATETGQSELLRRILISAIEDVASSQDMATSFVRAALFAASPGGSFRIPDGLAVNFTNPDETKIAIQAGESGVGLAVSDNAPVISIFTAPQVDSTIVDDEERSRIDPALRWIIAIPIRLDGADAPWVLAVDGLNEARTEAQLHSAVGRLLYYGELLQLLLKHNAK